MDGPHHARVRSVVLDNNAGVYRQPTAEQPKPTTKPESEPESTTKPESEPTTKH